ncbi:50S ribosomal protein 5 alpha, chloroplastic-like [Cucurbita maxima]|uniref:50S ribosomal protein 5 alpha, chloroplastic-like n=1 Tax=Cucurbita maxima TaxID=3661 RepID=A0A6J1HS41_CUCMA|nr:50S ribosomal protein 5 alpha, chloroplastic-like [Cucurbita maxima]
MAFLLCSNPLSISLHSSTLSPSPSPSPSCFPGNFSALNSMSLMKPTGFQPKHFNGVRLRNPSFVENTVSFIVKAASEIDTTGETDSNEPKPSAEAKKEDVPVDKLPLESKLQERLEQKARMKLAKKIRLRRKRLVRKRHLRKKGRWPPSKMKKLKNV